MNANHSSKLNDLDQSIRAAAFENEAVGMAIISPEGRWIYVNSKLCEITGYSDEELLDRHIDDIAHPDDVGALRQRLQGLLQGDFRSYTIEKRYIRKDGSIVPVRKSTSLVRNGDGEAQYLIAVIDDITQRKLAEADLAFQKYALDQSSIVAITDIQGTITYVNDKFCDISGYSREELIGQNHRIINSGLHPRSFFRDMYHTISHGKVWRGEIRNQRKDGSYYWVDTTIVPAVGMEGRLQGYVAIRTDITERKQAEEDLDFQKYALDQSTIVAITDVTGTITYANEKFCEISGYSRHELMGQNHRIINSGYHSKAFFRDMYLTISSGKVWRGEIRNRRKDGSFYWVDTTIVPALDSHGKPERYVAIRSDITERKRIEEQMRQSEARKDEFLAVLSHELRNPLAAIRTATSVLRAEEDGESLEQMVSVIERQSQQLTRLVDDLLDVSRITRGKIGLRMERIDLAAIVAEATECLPEACKRKGTNFALSLPPNPVHVMGDSLRILQVMGNLLSNACKFTSKNGNITISVAAERDEALIKVSDTGIGLAADQLSRVFEMFAQVDPQVRKTGGLGIGLALVKGITELHGGSVEARSEGEGMGSEFIVRLPLACVERTSSGPLHDGPAAAQLRPHRRILAVDDNPDALMTIAYLLRHRGHEVITAEGGAEAIDLARQHLPEIVLLDIGMPGMDGYEVARRIRRETWGRDLTLVAITGWGHEKDKRQAADAGFNAHLTKPVEPDVLENVLAQPRG